MLFVRYVNILMVIDMNKYYLEFLNELYLYISEDDSNIWSDWIIKSRELFEKNNDLSYFLSAFGGMGSFNDYYYENRETMPIVNVLKSITYSIANSIDNHQNSTIEDIIIKENERYIYNLKNGFNSEIAMQEYEYLKYLKDNYNYSNLHNINTKYSHQVLENRKQSKR